MLAHSSDDAASLQSVSKAQPFSEMVSRRRMSLFENFQAVFGLTDFGNSIENIPGKSDSPVTAYGRPVKVVPGRESHTADFEAFEAFLRRTEEIKRAHSEQTQYRPEKHSSTRFWDFMEDVLQMALPVGFEGDPEGSIGVVHKGPQDYENFRSKLLRTEIINPINPVTLAEASGVPLKDVISELLYATKAELMSMQWAPVCERCVSPLRTLKWANYDWVLLKKNPIKTCCQACRFENTIEALDKVKVFFMLSQSVFYTMAANFHCKSHKTIEKATQLKIHLPANSSGSGWRISVGCGGEKQYRNSLDAGKISMFWFGKIQSVLLGYLCDLSIKHTQLWHIHMQVYTECIVLLFQPKIICELREKRGKLTNHTILILSILT